MCFIYVLLIAKPYKMSVVPDYDQPCEQEAVEVETPFPLSESAIVASTRSSNSLSKKALRALKKLSAGGRAGRAKDNDDKESEWSLFNGITKRNHDHTDIALQPTNSPPPSPTKKQRLFDVTDDHKRTPPSPVHSIIENSSFIDLVETALVCKKCRGKVVASISTTCVASTPIVDCSKCSMQYIPESSFKTDLPDDNRSQRKMTDHGVNILYVLAFIASGDGGVEAQKVLGFVGLPNYCSMEKTSFPRIERAMDPYIRQITDAALREQMVKEVEATVGKDFPMEKFQRWKESLVNPSIVLPLEDRPKVSVSMDMGWQKRSSGMRYDSLSGHAALCGTLTRKPIMIDLKSKFCRVCTSWEKLTKIVGEEIAGPSPRNHHCSKNYDRQASSGSMEAAALVDMYAKLYDVYQVGLSKVITDDDSTMRSQCCWSNASYALANGGKEPTYVDLNGDRKTRKDSGKLSYPTPEPSFLADPAHRTKTLKGELYRLNNKKVDDKHGMGAADCIRISTNFTYMCHKLPSLPMEQWVNSSKAVLEHHFDNHEFCGDFCVRKLESEDEMNDSSKFYRSKVHDKELYETLHKLLARFITKDRLEEVGHGNDTKVNESLNMTIQWFAPKIKTLCGSVSLSNRLNIAIGVHLLGFDVFFKRLLEKMGVPISLATNDYLDKQAKKRATAAVERKKVEVKRKRKEEFHVRLEQHTKRLILD